VRAQDSQPDEPVPDYRVTLANERTFLAWTRTALGLLAGAVAIAQLVKGPDWLRISTSLLLAAVGLVVAVVGYVVWRQREAAIRRGDPIARPSVLLGASLVLVVLAVLVAVLAVGSMS
jgi:putative membrane protein